MLTKPFQLKSGNKSLIEISSKENERGSEYRGLFLGFLLLKIKQRNRIQPGERCRVNEEIFLR